MVHHDTTLDESSCSENLTAADGVSTSGSGSDEGPLKPSYIDPVIAEKEQRAVFWSKILVLLVLSIAVTAVATTTYLIISRGENHNFETQVCGVTFWFK